jgi:PAS domain S-box-containing protein
MMVGERVERRRHRLPPRPSSVAEARRMIRACLRDADREDLVETAELLVSEIVTNALVHAGTPIDVAFSLLDGGLRVEVSDGSPHAPARRGYGPNAGTGRGLMLLEELVDEWGVVVDGPGKTVWFQLASTSGLDDRSPGPAGTSRPDGETLHVELVDVPLLLHEAWRQHAESLLREYLLASLDLDSPADPIAVHAEASDAIALLAEHIPPSGVGEDPARVMVEATEPLVTEARVDLAVPVGSVGSFSTLEVAIETALGMVEDGMFLTPPTQPEVQGLREWLCGQVLGQSRGESPAPWAHDGPRSGRPRGRLAWDTAPVDEATTGMIAADDEDRVVAVSRPALDLLGYADPQELLGRRLVAIIPERYRQAHLAGFTMHFLSGRSLLLDRAVVVPALCRDGSEVTVELSVRAERADDGRTVFVAGLDRPAS